MREERGVARRALSTEDGDGRSLFFGAQTKHNTHTHSQN